MTGLKEPSVAMRAFSEKMLKVYQAYGRVWTRAQNLLAATSRDANDVQHV